MSSNILPEEHPPYVSVKVFEQFLQLLERTAFNQITTAGLTAGGISEGSSWSLLSTLRTMHLINDEGQVLDSDGLNRLGTRLERQSALRDILDRTYPNLLAEDFLQNAELSEVRDYFCRLDVTESTAEKATRLFLWLVEQAGYEINAKFNPVQQHGKQDATAPQTNRGGAEEPSEQQDANSNKGGQYSERWLGILLDKADRSEGLPDSATQARIDELILRVEEQEEKKRNQ